MKTRIYIQLLAFLSFTVIVIFFFSSFKRGTTILESGTYMPFYHESILLDLWTNNDGVVVNFNSFPNSLALAIPHASPSRWVSNSSGNAPRLVKGGQYNVPDGNVTNGPVRGNEISSLGIYNNGNQDVIAETFRSIKSGSTHREIDIAMNVNFKNPNTFVFGEPSTSQYNTRTILLHELCHGIGLEHVSASDSRLMQSNPKGVYLLSVTFDEQKAFNCFYGTSGCEYEGDGSGNLTLSTKIINDTLISNNSLTWLIETHDNNTIGFNIYILNSEGNYETLNTSMIDYKSDKDSYSFMVNDASDYYLEVVTNDLLNTKFIKL